MASCCSSIRVAEPVAAARAEGSKLPVAVIGGGPIGLAAAVHLLERGLEPIVLEAATSVGAAPVSWGHVHMFSPWRYNIDRAARSLLDSTGGRRRTLRRSRLGASLPSATFSPWRASRSWRRDCAWARA